jgi:hypothetical protein
MAGKRKFRAIEKLEWPDKKAPDGYRVVWPGEEFVEPDEKFNIDELVEHGAAELASKKTDA